MSKTTTMEVEVLFGDCGPAGIVSYPNFHTWMDAASMNFFMTCGVAPWHDLEPATGIVGTPLLEHHTRFFKSVTYGDHLTFTTTITEWRAKVFIQKHTITRGEDLIGESFETRVFCVRAPQEPRGLRAIAPPPDIRRLCEA
jgi:4-hydroxybenzoyl-CoA thioesterase